MAVGDANELKLVPVMKHISSTLPDEGNVLETGAAKVCKALVVPSRSNTASKCGQVFGVLQDS